MAHVRKHLLSFSMGQGPEYILNKLMKNLEWCKLQPGGILDIQVVAQMKPSPKIGHFSIPGV